MVSNSVIADWLQFKVLEDGVVDVNKPYGLPSNAIVEIVKKAFDQKVGHGGTLDPFAEGSLILGIGKGTKKLSSFLHGNKKYKTDIIFGLTSISDDLEQVVSIQESIPVINERQILDIVEQLKTEYIQKVPVFSAVKVKGKRMYDLAREGSLDIPQKEITTRLLSASNINLSIVTSSELSKRLLVQLDRIKDNFAIYKNISEDLNSGIYKKYEKLIPEWEEIFSQTIEQIDRSPQDFTILSIEVEVPKGTYIRSLATDIASRIGTIGMLLSLFRESTKKI